MCGMEKCFNIAGPCFPDEHYMLPALERLPGIMRIVEQKSYFVLHAARQSGKTTAGGCLACYRFDGEQQQLDATKLEWVNALLSVATEIAPEESVNAASC